MASNYIIFCRRIVSGAIIFSSLLCAQPSVGATQTSLANSLTFQMLNSGVRARSINSLLARAASIYHVTDTNRTLTSGEYSGVVIDVAASGNNPDIIFGTGTVTLTGQGIDLFDNLLATSLNSRASNAKIRITPTAAGNANLILQQGTGKGNINLLPGQISGTWYGVNLLIGPGDEGTELSEVNLTGRLEGISRNYITASMASGRDVTVQTQGANLTVYGGIGNLYYNKYIRHLNAWKGNIEAKADSEVPTSSGEINAVLASVKSGFHIQSEGDMYIYAVEMENESYIQNVGGDRIYLVERIGDNSAGSIGGGGKMEGNARIEAYQHLILIDGVEQAAGILKSTTRSIVTHDPTARITGERALASIFQGGTQPLKLEAAMDVLTGETDVDSITASTGDIIAGSSTTAHSIAPAGRIVANAGADGLYYPRYKISANTISAPNTEYEAGVDEKGRLIAGEVNMPRQDDKPANLTAAHLFTVKSDAIESSNLPSSTGNVNIKNGTMKLTSPDPLMYFVGDGVHSAGSGGDSTGQTLSATVHPYASHVAGNMTLTDVTGTFKSIDIDEITTITRGSIANGDILKTDTAIFDNVSETVINDTLDVTKNLTITNNGNSSVAKTVVGGSSGISDGIYTGNEFAVTGDAGFNGVHTLTMDKSLSARNVNITENGVATINAAEAKEAFSVSGGTYNGNTLISGSTVTLENISAYKIKDKATIGTALSAIDSEGAFNLLDVGAEVTVTGGTLGAGRILTGTTAGAKGDFKVNGADFSFGENSTEQSVIRGDLTGTILEAGSFGDLNVTGEINLSGGTLSGKKLESTSATLSANSLDVTDTLTLSGNMTLTGNVSSNVENAKITGDANISEGEFSGNVFSSANSVFENVSNLNLKSLSTGNLSISGTGKSEIAQASASKAVSVSGGSYQGESLSSGQDVKLENMSSANISGLTSIKGNLSASENTSLTFGQLQTEGSVDISGGKLEAAQISAGTTSSQGNVTLTNNTFTLATSDAESVIHGNLTSAGNNTGKFGNLTVEGVLAVSGGFIEGSKLEAVTGTLKDNAHVHIDELNLTGKDLELDIEDGSVLTVGTITGSYGNDLIEGGSLIILGDASRPLAWSERGDINLEDGDLIGESNYVRLKTGIISGNGQGENADDVRVHQLAAEGINISDANLFLTGLSDYASSVTNNLIIKENGQSRIGDLSVGGNVDISGGSVQGRQLKVEGNAAFADGDLNLAGTGEQGSAIKGNLTLQNRTSKLGDVEIGGTVNANGGAVEARILKTGSNVSMTGTALTLYGTSDKPGSIGGNLDLVNNTAANLGNLEIAGNFTGNGGSVDAATLTSGKNVSLTDVSLNLAGTAEKPGTIGGDFTLQNNMGANVGNLVIEGNAAVSGGTFSADSLHAKKDAHFSSVSLALQGTALNPDLVDGSLIIDNNESSKTAFLKVGNNLAVTGGSWESSGLETGGNAAFSSTTAAFKGTEAQPDKTGGNLSFRDNSAATIGYMQVSGKTSATGGKISATSLSSQNLSFTGTESKANVLKVTNSSDISGGNFNATTATFNSVSFHQGLIASLQDLTLEGASKNISVGAATDDRGKTEVKIDNLNLDGGTLFAGNVRTEPVAVAVRSFSQPDTVSHNINGNIAIGLNGRLILGSNQTSLTPQSLVNENAILALAHPARLGAGYGVHVTGAAAPAPVAGQIKFDPASLFVIDGSDARTYYTGEYIKSANLNTNNGVPGALSAENSVTANIGSGAQIYIRNPIPNTVIVALGENINTVYADTASRAKEAENNPWKDANLRYDNSDAVKIERLDGDYAGQFSVTPIKKDTPDSPAEPDNPSTPDTPATPENPSTPSTPENPGNTPDTPTQPDTPVTDTPAQPDTPGTDNTSKPSKPVKPSETHPDAHPGIHDVITNEGEKDNIGKEPHHVNRHDGAGFISNTIIHDNPHQATHLVEGAVRVPVTGAVPQLAMTANRAGEKAMDARTGIENLLIREDDLHARSIALWAVPLYKTLAGWDMDAGSHDYDFHGGIGGIAIGGDVTLEDIIRLGISFNIGGGYSKSGGELSQTENNMNFWGLGAYGVWYFSNFALSGNVSYTSSYNKVKQDISSLPSWSELKSDLQAHVLSAGMQLEYRIATDLLDILPHIGARYHYVHVNDYDITHRGNDIIKGNDFSQNIWTFPVGLKMAKTFNFENGWELKPMLDLRVTPAAGDIEVKTTSRFTGTSTDISLKTQTMDYVTFGGTVGFEASIKNFAIGVNYSMEAGAKSVSNTIFGTLRYEF